MHGALADAHVDILYYLSMPVTVFPLRQNYCDGKNESRTPYKNYGWIGEFSQPVIHLDPQRHNLFCSLDTASKRTRIALTAAAQAQCIFHSVLSNQGG